jgi:ATP synthase I chain
LLEALRKTQKKVCSRAMVVAIVAGLVLIIIGYKPIAKGLILGTLFSVVNFVLMGETLTWRLSPSRKRATVISMLSIMLRYALLGVPIVVAVKFSEYNLPAVVVGLFLVQIVLLGEHITKLATSSFRKQG